MFRRNFPRICLRCKPKYNLLWRWNETRGFSLQIREIKNNWFYENRFSSWITILLHLSTNQRKRYRMTNIVCRWRNGIRDAVVFSKPFHGRSISNRDALSINRASFNKSVNANSQFCRSIYVDTERVVKSKL